MNYDGLKRFNPSRKAATLLTCGAILVGATLNFGVSSVAPYLVIHNANVNQLKQNDQMLSDMKALNAKIDADRKFTQIEAQLKPIDGYTAGSVTLGRYVETTRTKANSHFLHQLFPIVPGWSSYMGTLYASDDVSAKSSAQMKRTMLWQGMKDTCDMVTDLNAGLDISKTHATSDTEAYKGKYLGGAGYVLVKNPEIFLKACGDENLKYLPELKAEQKQVKDDEATIAQNTQQGMKDNPPTEQK